MKLLFRSNGTLWIVDRSEREEDVEGCVSILAPNDFNVISSSEVVNDSLVETFKTLTETQAELGV